MNQHVSRRNVFARSAAIAAAAVVPFEANAAQGEAPVAKVNRLARELSSAMSDWMEEIEEPSQGYAHWIAVVHPAHIIENPVSFLNTATDSWPFPRASDASPVIRELAAKFDAELEKLNALSPEHDAAERRYWEACPARPVEEPISDEESALMEMRIKDFRDSTHPYNVEQAERYRAFKIREAAYDAERASLRKSTGLAKMERAYNAQVSRTCRAAERVLRHPAQSVAELGVKARVYGAWNGDEGVVLDALLADIARMTKRPALPTPATGKKLPELETLIAAHVAALAEYDAVPDDEFNGTRCQALGRIVDIKRQALLDYHPLSLAEAARKAAFMGSCRTFVEWDDLDRAVLIKAFQIA